MHKVSASNHPPPSPVFIEQSAARYVLRGTSIWLEFDFSEDRWQHRIGCTHNVEHSPALTSLEGRASDASPASPAFQDLRLESLSDSIHEFQLMGQSGPAVYSAAIRFDDALGQIEFDVCARLRKPAVVFRAVSTYALQKHWYAKSTTSDRATIGCRDQSGDFPELVIQPLAIPTAQQEIERAPQVALGETIAIGWHDVPIADRRADQLTLRWRYRIALISPAR